MFAIKNSIVLAGIWLVLLITGIFLYVSDTHKLVNLREQRETAINTLTESQEQIKRLTEVENIHAEIQKDWLNSQKRIISADEPSFTLTYINWLITTHSLQNLYYDFDLNEKKQIGDHTQFIYTLRGEGTYTDIHKLVWYLTYEPILYKITSLSLSPTAAESDYIRFTIKLRGFTVESSTQEIEDFTQYRPAAFTYNNNTHNIFRPLVSKQVVNTAPAVESKPKLPAKLPGQIDVERAALKAVLPNSIYISEGKSGTVELKIGDPVYLGRLVRINQNTNEAEFVLTKFGKSERITLRINERN